MDFVSQINDQNARINPSLKKALNKFFKEVDCVEGCILRRDWDGRPYTLIIESSYLYDYLSGEFGWSIHDKFFKSFEKCDYSPEMVNSCVVGFYKK